MTVDRCELRLTRRFNASRSEVWAALTEPQSLKRWLADVIELELAPGGNVALELPGDGRIAASVRELQPPRVLELAWSFAGEEPSIVRFELTQDGDDTVLVLDHRLIDERFGMAYSTRWTSALQRLGAQIEQ